MSLPKRGGVNGRSRDMFGCELAEIECFPDVFALIARELRRCSFDPAAMKQDFTIWRYHQETRSTGGN